jgi:predicted DNA-binding WGR domain protein
VRRWEYVGDGSDKFWEAESVGTSVTVRFGRSGTDGQTRVKEFDTPEAARAFLVKAIAEKERKGYKETSEISAAPKAPEASEASEASEAPSTVRPDEDTFVLPAAWKRNLHPRRGGVRRAVPAIDTDAGEKLRQWLARDADVIERLLGSASSDPALVEAARAHRDGTPNAVGAAVLARMVNAQDDGYATVADAWATEFGLPFAACAAVELQETQNEWQQKNNRSFLVGIRLEPEGSGTWGRKTSQVALDRVRALLAVTDEATYRAAVDALSSHRHSVRRAVSVSFLVPTERAWVDECCARRTERAHAEVGVRTMLLCSLGTAEQVALFGERCDLGWRGWNPSVVATLAEGVGAAMAPLLAGELDREYIDTDDTKAMAAALSELPSDAAFRHLIDRMENKHVRTAAVAAARRFPARAVRLLAEAARGTDDKATTARRMLHAQVAAHRETALSVLPDLPAELAEIVAPLAHQEGRVDDAAPESLPELLTAPPWTRPRKAVVPRVVSGLVAPPDARIVWQPGEQRVWATAESWVTGWEPYRPMEELVEQLRSGRLSSWHDVAVFTYGPVEDVRPLLAEWNGGESVYDGPDTFKPLVARHELAALPPALRIAAANPTSLAPLLLPFVDAAVARLMADWLERLKVAGRTATAWFLRHGADAARLLVPDALGQPGAARTAAERALTLIVSAHGADTVRRAAVEYGEEAAEAIEVLLDSDPLEAALPARMPQPGTWADPAALPQLVTSAGGALPSSTVRHVLTMLAVSRPGALYPGVTVVKELCTRDSLTAFAWALFEEWRLAGMPAKDAWALHALGWFGDDETVRALTPIIRAWPGEGAHHRAVDGLEVLAAIGTDVALLHLHGIAQRVKFKALKLRAQEKIAAVAAELGLTGEQLADRLVPDLGLDADGSTVVDYGTRRFTVGFDEQLRPFVRDESGRRLKDLPKPGVRDDAELAPAERKRFTALKKDARTIASDQVRRLEEAMVTRRSWTGAEFRQLFVEHPLVWHLVRRLVWLGEAEGTVTAFRVAEDRTYADGEDETVSVADDATVTLAHPLLMGAAELETWSELFADYEIVQPFPQLGRPVFAVTEEEAGGARLQRFEGVTVPVGKLLGLQKRGWERGEPQDAGVERWFSRRIGPECYLVIALDEGIAVGMIDQFPDQTLETIWLDRQPGDHWGRREYTLTFGDLDPVTVSELLADLTELTS